MIERLHQVDLERGRARAERADVLVDVLSLGDEVALDRRAKDDVGPQRTEPLVVRAADGGLPDAEFPVGAGCVRWNAAALRALQ